MDNNPLRQYFRRPAVYIKLPSGGKDYSPDLIDMPENGELPVFPMTAIDEVTSRTPDALFNGTALAELVKSCIPAIKDPWQISSNDMDAILIAIKAASSGDTLELETTCPSCQESSTYGVSLLPILSTLKPGDYETPIVIGDLSIKFKPLRYRDMNEAALGQFEIQRTFATLESIESEEERNRISKEALDKITFLTMDLLSQSIEHITTPNTKVEDKKFILDFLKNCDRNNFILVRDYNAKLRTDTEIKPLHITCSSCEHEYDQAFSLSPVDFFD
jgi:hypothetical protein